jgi:hypothetical protein
MPEKVVKIVEKKKKRKSKRKKSKVMNPGFLPQPPQGVPMGSGRSNRSLTYAPGLKSKTFGGVGALRSKAQSSLGYKALLSFALPGDSPAIRLGKRFGADPSAVAKLHRRPPFNYPQPNTHQGDLPTTDCTAFLFRDALRSFIASYGNDGGYHHLRV